MICQLFVTELTGKNYGKGDVLKLKRSYSPVRTTGSYYYNSKNYARSRCVQHTFDLSRNTLMHWRKKTSKT
jgi:hypothetical protein